MSFRALLTGLACLCVVSFARAEKQPNIVFFLVDDLGYADCGFNGGKEIRTPVIDARRRVRRCSRDATTTRWGWVW